ncbi:hypothetical protein Mgra_00001865 [Meloidogyne graminicola]|uniref:Uncharacterized protein n=1 Tax=Meloidogyne graminicola TaxID=189291 RepID=A0A8S9ZYE3_9BILA|nr:hypothetical protein Mgra_00001865 [Meloidogyne graminicola]
MSPLEANSLKWMPLNLKNEFEKRMKLTTTTTTISTTTITTTINNSSIICSSNQNIIILSSKGYKLADITKRIKRNELLNNSIKLEQNEMTENECIFN